MPALGRQIVIRLDIEEHESMSWDEAFASHYDEWSAHMTADVAFYVSLALQADGPLVELAIGNGRVAIPIAQATGQCHCSPYTADSGGTFTGDY
jgi:hypothetical protein